jgi:hypothetical protein
MMNIRQRRPGLIVKFTNIIIGLLLTSSAFAVPVQYSGNGHWYDTVNVANQGGSWTAAKDSAELLNGYLVTITTSLEQEFLEDVLSPVGSWWAGGSDKDIEGTWKWLTGPETGRQFWSGDEAGSATAPNMYANWRTYIEPNNFVIITRRN